MPRDSLLSWAIFIDSIVPIRSLLEKQGFFCKMKNDISKNFNQVQLQFANTKMFVSNCVNHISHECACFCLFIMFAVKTDCCIFLSISPPPSKRDARFFLFVFFYVK